MTSLAIGIAVYQLPIYQAYPQALYEQPDKQMHQRRILASEMPH